MRGTAVVASESGGLAEIVEQGQSGFLVRPGESVALARALQSLISNQDLAEQMGQAGRRRAMKTFSESACLDAFLALYGRLRNGA